MNDYYKREIKGTNVEVCDIIDAWKLDAYTAQAVQYILRSKFKKDEFEDLCKARDFLIRKIRLLRDDMKKTSPYLDSFGGKPHD